MDLRAGLWLFRLHRLRLRIDLRHGERLYVCDTSDHFSRTDNADTDRTPVYSQCQPSSATSTATAPTSSSSICSGTRTKFQFFGVNESGAEFGNNIIPGALGTEYTWPAPSSIDFFMGRGFNTFRVPFLMERVSPPSTGGLSGPFNATYLSGLKDTVSYITGKGGYAAIDREYC